MKRIIVVCCVALLLAGCGGGVASLKKSDTTPSMKKQMQTTMDKLNKAMPYIVNWSAYKTGTEPQRMLKTAQELVAAYPSLRKYLNAQGLFDPADYDKVEKAIDTEDPL